MALRDHRTTREQQSMRRKKNSNKGRRTDMEKRKRKCSNLLAPGSRS
jgi:hypothetical protein